MYESFCTDFFFFNFVFVQLDSIHSFFLHFILENSSLTVSPASFGICLENQSCRMEHSGFCFHFFQCAADGHWGSNNLAKVHTVS